MKLPARLKDLDLGVPGRGRQQLRTVTGALDRAGRGPLPRLRTEDLTDRRNECAIDLGQLKGGLDSSRIVLGHRAPPRWVDASRVARWPIAFQTSSGQTLLRHETGPTRCPPHLGFFAT